jgi:hypothetical protein
MSYNESRLFDSFHRANIDQDIAIYIFCSLFLILLADKYGAH